MILLSLVPTICVVALGSTTSTTIAFQFQPAAADPSSRLVISRSRGRFRTYPTNPRILPQRYAMDVNVEDILPLSTKSSLQFTLPDEDIDFSSLMVMDVVLFQRRAPNENSNTLLELGAVQENKNVAPLSTWTLESAYTTSTNNDMLQFVVDENDIFPGLSASEMQVWMVLDGSVISYGSRQVGGGKGPGNPHGEESELIYYIDRNVVERKYVRKLCDNDAEELSVDVVVNPKLEHLW